MSYRVRDENGKAIPDRVYGGDMLYGRERVEERLREQGRTLSKAAIPSYNYDTVDAMAFALTNWERKRTFELRHDETEKLKLKENEKMGRPYVQLKTDKCGRYHYATAYLSRTIVLKDGCTYEERIEAIGVSRRQHGDPKDDYVGEGLAVGRAMEDLGYKLSRRAWGKVKHNDDIKVMRRQQKERRQAKAQVERNSFVQRLREVARI